LAIIIPTDEPIFQRGWNHQPETFCYGGRPVFWRARRPGLWPQSVDTFPSFSVPTLQFSGRQSPHKVQLPLSSMVFAFHCPWSKSVTQCPVNSFLSKKLPVSENHDVIKSPCLSMPSCKASYLSLGPVCNNHNCF
jgi:hypothetical protein